MTLIDSHCHLNHPDFDLDYQNIITDCLQKGIGLLIVGDDFETSQQAVEIANKYAGDSVYAAIGIHPNEFMKEGFDEKKYQELICKKVVAVGEIGLDYYHKPSSALAETSSLKQNIAQTPSARRLGERVEEDWKEKQKEGFKKQLEFAMKNNLPVILHARGSKEDPEDAYTDILSVISNFQFPISKKGVIHCFGSTLEIAERFVGLGFLVGLTGIITFKNKSADPLREVVRELPLTKILIETDAPFLAPEPKRGERCLPSDVELVARQIAGIKNVDYEEVVQQTSENFEKLFLRVS